MEKAGECMCFMYGFVRAIFWISLGTMPVIAGGEESTVFKQAIARRAFSFPADHASHAGYQTEWWYVTGNLKTESNRAFGFQFTIFRRAIDPQSPAERGRTSAWAAGDLFLLHLAVSDLEARRYLSGESLQRGVLGVAGATDTAQVSAQSPEISVWMKGAQFVRTTKGWSLKAAVERVSVELEFVETQPPVLHGLPGEEGLSRKGPQPGQASYYYSVPRLTTSGSLTIEGKAFKIASGLSWMDHEFGSNQLSPDQAGWEWFSLHLDSGHALMLYVLRNKDGTTELRSSGTWIEPGGKVAHLALKDFEFTPGRKWKSPHSGTEYVLDWTIKIPTQLAELRITAAQDDQEFRGEKGAGVNYYEGAVRIEGRLGDRATRGEGYLEITAKTLGGKM